jgi:hypothetical protein
MLLYIHTFIALSTTVTSPQQSPGDKSISIVRLKDITASNITQHPESLIPVMTSSSSNEYLPRAERYYN